MHTGFWYLALFQSATVSFFIVVNWTKRFVPSKSLWSFISVLRGVAFNIPFQKPLLCAIVHNAFQKRFSRYVSGETVWWYMGDTGVIAPQLITKILQFIPPTFLETFHSSVLICTVLLYQYNTMLNSCFTRCFPWEEKQNGRHFFD